MGFWLTVCFLLLIYLAIVLILKVIEEKRVKNARADIPGKVVVITGANSILGEALAHAFYRAGCRCVLVGPNEQELERVRVHLFGLRPKDVPVYQPECVVLNLIDMAAIQGKVGDILEQYGQVDVLINAASICTRSDVLSSTVEADIRVMNVNYFAPVAFTKALLPSMIHRKSGKVVFVSSVAGKVPIPFRSSFAASKHALQAFSDSLRAEIAMHKVKVLVSSPEYIAMDLSMNEMNLAGTAHEVLEKGMITLGDPPHKIADDIFMAVLRDDTEDTPIAFKFAHWLRVTCPPFFHFMMARRAEQTIKGSAAAAAAASATAAAANATETQRF